MPVLSTEQMEQIYSLLDKKGIRWYDLKVELADHLASAVEEKLQEQKDKDFNIALAEVYKSFGISGFSNLVQERQKNLQDAAGKMWYAELAAFFKPPQLLVLAGLLLINLCIAVELQSYLDLLVTFRDGVFVAVLLAFIIYLFLTRKRRNQLILIQYGSRPYSTLLTIYLLLFRVWDIQNPVIFSISTTAGLVMFWAYFVVTRRVNRTAENLYPQFYS